MVGIAVVTIIARKKTQTRKGLWGLLHYCMQDKKTIHNGRKLVTGINCVAQSAFNEMVNTKLQYRKSGGRQYYHIMQSFHPDEPITPETAHEIALRFAEENFPGYEVLVATHVDRHHVHSHFVVNSVNAETGLKFHSDNHEIQRLRDASDRLCVEYGFSVVVPKSKTVKGMSTAEYHVAEKGQSWKLDLAMAIDEAMRYAVSKEHFIELMEMEGYEVKWKDTHKYITYTCPNGKPCRDIRLHEEKYLKENMEDEFRIRKEIIARAEGSGTEKSGRGKADDELRFRKRPIGYAGGAVEGADGSRRADGTDPDGVSGDTSSTGGSDSDSDLDFNGELPITGWESERELLTATLIGGTNGEAEFEEADFGFAYPDYPADHLGIDSAYLAGDVMNILDNDSHTEDCTTMNQPPHNKKNTQSGGFKMSM